MDLLGLLTGAWAIQRWPCDWKAYPNLSESCVPGLAGFAFELGRVSFPQFYNLWGFGFLKNFINIFYFFSVLNFPPFSRRGWFSLEEITTQHWGHTLTLGPLRVILSKLSHVFITSVGFLHFVLNGQPCTAVIETQVIIFVGNVNSSCKL